MKLNKIKTLYFQFSGPKVFYKLEFTELPRLKNYKESNDLVPCLQEGLYLSHFDQLDS